MPQRAAQPHRGIPHDHLLGRAIMPCQKNDGSKSLPNGFPAQLLQPGAQEHRVHIVLRAPMTNVWGWSKPPTPPYTAGATRPPPRCAARSHRWWALIASSPTMLCSPCHSIVPNGCSNVGHDLHRLLDLPRTQPLQADFAHRVLRRPCHPSRAGEVPAGSCAAEFCRPAGGGHAASGDSGQKLTSR